MDFPKLTVGTFPSPGGGAGEWGVLRIASVIAGRWAIV